MKVYAFWLKRASELEYEQPRQGAIKGEKKGFTYIFLLDDIPLRSFLAHYAIPKTMFGYKENGHMNFFLLIPRLSWSTDK